MNAYADASLLVSALTRETSSALAEQWLAHLGAGELATSAWVETEVASALSAKMRAGELEEGQQEVLLANLQLLLRSSARFIQIERVHFSLASSLLMRSSKPLRASDALHLAVAAEKQVTLWTLDRRMAEAGHALGLGTRLLA